MFLVSGPELVIAACRNGIIGSFPTPNCRTAEELERWLVQITVALSEPANSSVCHLAPWSANLIVHRTNARPDKDLALIVKYQAPIVITALGSPRAVIDAVHSYGGILFADVNSLRYAEKAVAAGVDGLVLVSAGSGGHTGQLAGFAFVPAVRRFFDGPLVLAGAISDGRAIRAAEVLGADFAYVGTRFIAAEESLAQPAYKQMVVGAGIEDIFLSRAVTGVYANWLGPSLVAAGFDASAQREPAGINFDQPDTSSKRWKDIWAAGQGVAATTAIEPVSAIVERLKTEYLAARETPGN